MSNRFYKGSIRLSRLGAVLMAGLIILTLCLCPALFTGINHAYADRTSSDGYESDAEIAEELANPIAGLVHIPVQINYDQDIGPDDDGWRLQTNLQPVIPFHCLAQRNGARDLPQLH